MSANGRNPKKSKWAASWVASAILLLPWPAAAQNQLCVPTGNWVDPTIDGQLTDQGWIQASRHVYANGTGNPHGALQAEWKGGYLFVSLEAHNDDGVNKNDIAILAFGASGDARMLELRPTLNTGNISCAPYTNGGLAPAQAFWRTGGTFAAGAWSWSGPANNPSITAMYGCDDGTGGTTASWVVEVKIPASLLPAGPSFPFYGAIVRSGTIGQAQVATELTWPPATATATNWIVGSITNLPDPTPSGSSVVGWGTMMQSASDCPGMYVASWASKIKVNGSSSKVIKGGATNTFEVWVSNSSPKAYDKIKASFYYQRFGINAGSLQMIGGWTPIPPPAGGFGPEATMAPGSTASPVETRLDGLSWTIPAGGQAPGHACVAAVLDQGAGATVPAEFQTRGGVENMEFDGMSKFKGQPVVSAARLKPAPGESKVHLGLQLSPDFRVMRADGRSPVPKGTPVVRLNVPVHGYQFTRTFIEIDGQKLEIVDPISSFAYVLDHPLSLDTSIPATDPRVARMRGGPLSAGVDPFAAQVQPREALSGPSSLGQLKGNVPAPSISLADFGIRLDGVDRREEATLYVDLDPDAVRVLDFTAEYPPKGCPSCGCVRLPSPTMGLILFGLVLVAPLRRRRKP